MTDGSGMGAHTYHWDAENRLISTDSGSTAIYTFKALGERVEKDVGGTYTEYAWQASGEELSEHNRTNWTLRVVSFARRHLVHYQGSPDAAYFMHDTKLRQRETEPRHASATDVAKNVAHRQPRWNCIFQCPRELQ